MNKILGSVQILVSILMYEQQPNQTKPRRKPGYIHQTNQKQYFIVQMKSAKGEPMNGNMPAVRFKT
jgi:hypothetical protein